MKNEQRILKKKHSNSGYRYHVGGVYYDDDKQRYIRYYRRQESKYIKRRCNRRIRKVSDEIGLGGLYKKFTQFWNELY